MISGATYSSVPTRELVLTEGWAASSILPLCSLCLLSPLRGVLPLPRDDRLTEGRCSLLGVGRTERRPRPAGPGRGGVEGGVEGVVGVGGGAATSSGAVCRQLTYDRSKSVSMQCPLRCSRMFSGLRSLQIGLIWWNRAQLGG